MQVKCKIPALLSSAGISAELCSKYSFAYQRRYFGRAVMQVKYVLPT
jgi:hypothetical protein